MPDPVPPAPPPRPKEPLHGVTLRCFTNEPSVASSLKFLRKTPWAREKVENLTLFMLREQRRAHAGTPLTCCPAQDHP